MIISEDCPLSEEIKEQAFIEIFKVAS